MKRASALLFLATVALSCACAATPGFAEEAPLFLGIESMPRSEMPPALVAGQPVALRFLLPEKIDPGETAPKLFQVGGSIAQPVESEFSLSADPLDSRVTLLRFTPPPVTRTTRFLLRFGQLPPRPLLVFPAADRRETRLALLDEALRQSRLRLFVSGKADELRAYLRAQKLDFEDLGADSPGRLGADALLLAPLTDEEWQHLSVADAPRGARLLAFVSDPAQLPGVYHFAPAAPAPERTIKVTLPLPDLLSPDPRARETLHLLLLTALAPAQS